tara:strand:- start:795 stop:1523 length:729 start_codon:yes stop_codon:yes gene_type:complete
MNLSSKKLKIIFGIFYLAALFFVLYFLFSIIDLKDFTSYEFIRSNKEIITKYKNENFLFLTTIFFIFSVIWVLLLGFAGPILLFAGFVFGKWWGISISIIATTIGATLLYLLAGIFFKKLIKEKLEPKFVKFNEFFKKNELFYFTLFRFIGGGGMPYGIQNVLPVLFNISTKNYFFGTLIGSGPPMFVSVALGAGLQNFIDKNYELSFFQLISSPDIYLPIIGFLVIIVSAFFVKKFFFNTK